MLVLIERSLLSRGFDGTLEVLGDFLDSIFKIAHVNLAKTKRAVLI